MAEPHGAEPITPTAATRDVVGILEDEARFHKRQAAWHRKQAQRRMETLRRMKPMLEMFGIKVFIDGIDEGGQSQDDDNGQQATI